MSVNWLKIGTYYINPAHISCVKRRDDSVQVFLASQGAPLELTGADAKELLRLLEKPSPKGHGNSAEYL